ncbi:YcxB family protein [Agrobacterium vitis]|uniref:YcxB family protein n=1 Tax=Agrobacterium vitis TaxID=373 RepID=UPI0018D214B1
MAQIASNPLHASSAILAGDAWIIVDQWGGEDIKKVAQIVSSALRPQNIVAHATRRILFFLFIVFVLISVGVLAACVAALIYNFLLRTLNVSIGNIFYISLWFAVFMALKALLVYLIMPRFRNGKLYKIRQTADGAGLIIELPGMRSELRWSHVGRLIDDADYIILMHEDGRHYFSVPKRAFGPNTVQEFLSFCRKNMADAQTQN